MTNTASFHFGDPLVPGLDMLEVAAGYPLDLMPGGGRKKRKSRSKSTKKVKRARKGKMKKSLKKYRKKSLKKSRKTNRKKSRKMRKRKNSSKGKSMRGGFNGLAEPTCSR